MRRILGQLYKINNANNLMKPSMWPRFIHTSKIHISKSKPMPDNQQQSQSSQVTGQMQPLLENMSLTPFEHVIRVIGGLPFAFGGFYTVNKNHVGVIEYMGKYFDTKTEGLRFNLPFGRNNKYIFVGLRSLNLDKSKILDKHGNPIIVSAMLTFFVNDPIKFVYNCDDPLTFLSNQASACVKDIGSKYSYDELKNETADITNEATDKIQKLCEMSGIKIERLNLTDLCYAQEIAQAMLVKQQALAHIEAKKMVVDSSVAIVKDIIDKMNMDEKSKNRASVNLLTVLVSNSGVQTVVPLN